MNRLQEPLEVQAAREIVFTRVIRAPRPQVFNAWTDPVKLVQWWGPDGFKNTSHYMDLRPGGSWKFTMDGPDGTSYPNLVLYQEVNPPGLLVYMHGSDDEEHTSFFRVNVHFVIERKFTRLTIRAVYPTVAARDQAVHVHGAIEGGQQTLNRLEAFLKTED